jgi:DNA primase large subunit
MLCVLVGEKVLTQRYAAAEARRVNLALSRDRETIEPAAGALGVRLARDGEAWRMHMADYLMAAPSDTTWKLILRPVERGQVPISVADAQRLVQEALQRRIMEELEAEGRKPLPAEAKAALTPVLVALGPQLEEARERWSSGDFGPVQPGLFPPCVKWIFEELKAGKNLPHHARFAFATFLNTIGWKAEQILDYLATTPNFDREKSRYQIEHVTGQKGVEAYMVPNCATMQTNGVCPLDKRDGICFRIKNPLSYYRKRLYLQKRDGEGTAPESKRETPGKPVVPTTTESRP